MAWTRSHYGTIRAGMIGEPEEIISIPKPIAVPDYPPTENPLPELVPDTPAPMKDPVPA